jgi:peroxin-2
VFLLPLLPHRKLRRLAGTAANAILHPLTAILSLVPTPARAVFGLSPYREQSDAQLNRRGKFAHLPEDECAICYENATTTTLDPNNALAFASAQPPPISHRRDEPPAYPLTTPYRTSCVHIYCYTCIAEKMLRAAEEGEGPWECLRCAERVLGAERFYVVNLYWESEGDEGSTEDWGSDYFDEMGSSSLSGVSGTSAGSQSWVSGSDED